MQVKNVKCAAIGLGGRGSSMLAEFVSIPGIEVVAVCDKYEDRAKNGVKIVEEKAGNTPDMYLNYKELLERKDISAVICCTTWITHSKIAVDAMRAGKDVAIEVGGAASVEECWQLVRASEETGKFCMMLENCCYDRNELALFNMCRQGVFGEIVHMQGGYQHDLRDEILCGKEARHGRLVNFINRNGELYPTHQLGPISKIMGINRGNRILSLVSMSSKARGLYQGLLTYMPDHELIDTIFEQGDIVTTMLKCAHGETIMLIHDCSTPRPYSRNYRIQGTKGIYMEDNQSIYIDEVSSIHEWEDFAPYREEYEHPLWKQYAKDGIHAGGHGGMDYLVLCAFAEALQTGKKPPIDVYDTVTWMSITCLSEQSVALGGTPVAVPDFTNGMWIDREPFERGKYCLEEVCHEFFE